MRASSNAFRTSGRSSVTRPTLPSISTFNMARTSHPEDTEAGVLYRSVERRRDREAQQAARVRRIDDAVVPQPCAGVVGVALALVLLSDRLLESFFLSRGRKVAAHRGEHRGRLLAAHDGDAGVGPHPQEPRRVRT